MAWDVVTGPLKRLERTWKEAWMRGLAASLPVPPRGDAPVWSAGPRRVLYLRYDRIGDMILATGLIRAIASSHPLIELDVLASPGNASMLDGNPHVRSVRIFRRRARRSWLPLFRELRRARYDAVVDGMVLAPSLTTLLLMLATRARYRIGVGGRSNDFIYTHPVPSPGPTAHIAAQSGATAAPFGVDVARADWTPRLYLTLDERTHAEAAWSGTTGGRGVRVLVNISTAQPRHRWPDDRFILVLRALAERHPAVHIRVTGAPAEAASVRHVARESGALPLDVPLREVLALVATADMVFTPDTSIGHMAAAFGKPHVVMLRRRMEIFAPYGGSGRHVYTEGASLAELPPEPVLAALEEVLGGVLSQANRGV